MIGATRRIVFLLLLAGAPAEGWAQTGAPVRIHHPDASPPERVELAGAAEAPLTLLGSLPIVDVRVNGEGPFRFGIETGSASVIVVPDLATRLALPRAGGPDQFPEYRVETLQIGPATFHGLPVSTMTFAQPGIDGILGLSLYRDLLMTVDYPGRKVRFERGSLPDADGSVILPLTRVGPFWGLPITAGDAPLTAVLDTRSSGAFGFTPESSAALRFDGDLRVVGRARGAAIAETEVRAGRLASDITIGRYRFPRPTVTVRALPPGFPTAPIIGSRVLAHFSITLDQRTARLRMAREGSPVVNLDESAAVAPPRAAAASPELAQFAGRYGVREVRLADGGLVLQRDGGPPLAMMASGVDAFSLAAVPEAKIEFVRDQAGAVVAMRVLTREGQWETARRER
jgi:hypothetical protein